MAINEALRAIGDWTVKLRSDTPAEIIDLLQNGYFGHIAVTAAREDVRVSGDSLLRSARYNGVLRGLARTTDQGFQITGPGMAMWLGDEDHKGLIYESPIAFNSATFSAAINGLLPPSVTAGTIGTVPGAYSQVHQYQDPRTAIDYVCDTLGADWRVNGDATLDAGLTADLFVTAPKAAVIARKPGIDGTIRSFPGTSELDEDVDDFSTRVLLIAQSTDTSVETGSADIASGLNPYVDLHGNTLNLTRMVSESDTSGANADARAQLQLNRFTSPRDSLTLNSDSYDIRGDVAVGDYLWAYDEASGLVDTTNEIHFLGERIAPVKLRLFKLSWPVTAGMGVAFRSHTGQWVDLTDYVVFETGTTTLTVGGYDRALISSGDSSITGRIPVPDSSIPDQPTWVTPFVQGEYRSASGLSRAQVQLAWTRPTNTDGSTIVDGDHYEIRYRTSVGSVFPTTWSQAAGETWNTASGQPWGAPVAYVNGPWQTAIAPFDALSFLLTELTPNLAYQAQIRAVDTASPPNYGAWNTVTSFQTVEDAVPPVTPAPPTAVGNTMSVLVTHTLGAASGGTFNLDLDCDHLDVYASYEPTFTPSTANKLGDMPASAGLIRGQVPSVKTFQVESTATLYIKVVAVDTAGNRSNASDSVAVLAGLIPSQYIANLVADKITSGTVTAVLLLAGEIATGPALQGMHMNNGGLQGYRPDGTKVLDFETSDGSLLVIGEVRTAMSGQHLAMNPGGVKPDSIYVFPNGSGDFGRIFARTAPADGSAAILIDGGAAAGAGRGRLGAYKGEAFVSWVSSDSGGDTESGYSQTAVSCNASGINTWTQSTINFDLYSGSSIVSMGHMYMKWVSGSSGSYCPILTANIVNAGIKFDAGAVLCTINEGTVFGPCKASAFTVSSTQDSKTDIVDAQTVFTPLDVIAAAPAKAYKYLAEVEQFGDAAPMRFGPLAEQLPPELVHMTPTADGSGLEKSVSLGDQYGTLWAAVNQLLRRRITATTATCVAPVGTALTAGGTKEVVCTWESSPLATPTDAIAFVNVGLLGAGKVTAYVKPGSITQTGCTVVFKNISAQPISAVLAALSGLSSLTATVVGFANYTPPLAA